MDAVIMAGGLGTRLRPLTYAIPKPLIPIGDKPIMEILIRQLHRSGLARAFVSTGYKRELIKSYFGSGERLGVDIHYIDEDEPLGTAGALNLIRDQLTQPFIMVNGDILTRLDFGHFFANHVASGNRITAGVAPYEIQIPYGVVRSNGSAIDAVVEKPTEKHWILAGVYALSPAALEQMPVSGRYDLPDLIRSVIESGGQVGRHEIAEFWMDVGRMDDYETAIKVVASWEDV